MTTWHKIIKSASLPQCAEYHIQHLLFVTGAGNVFKNSGGSNNGGARGGGTRKSGNKRPDTG